MQTLIHEPMNDIKRQRIINQYKDFYTLYYEAVDRQRTKSASAQERVGSVVDVTTNQKEMTPCN